MKAAFVGLCLLFSVGCAGLEWTNDVQSAVDPIAQKGLPFAGDALIALSADFYVFCPVEQPRSETCLRVRDTLNVMIDEYNKVNNTVLEAY